MSADFFDYVRELPDASFDARRRGLVGFDARYDRIGGNLRLVLERNEVEAWSKRAHGRVLPAVRSIADRYPLVLFEGDVGTGKTATAESSADRLCRDLGREGQILKLSTRVRGQGLHGEMERRQGEGVPRLPASAWRGVGGRDRGGAARHDRRSASGDEAVGLPRTDRSARSNTSGPGATSPRATWSARTRSSR